MTLSEIIAHYFTPKESNNHRSKLLHPQAFLWYIVIIIFISFSMRLFSKVAPSILGIATNISVNDLLQETNEKRAETGLKPLTLNQKLSQAAALKAQDMFTEDYWAHFSPKGKTPWDFIMSSDYEYKLAGENLARDFDNSSSVVDAWMNSTSHKDNILKPDYQDIGFAIVNGKLNGQETTLVVQMFGTLSVPQIARDTQESQPKLQEIENITEIAPDNTLAQKQDFIEGTAVNDVPSQESTPTNIEKVNNSAITETINPLFIAGIKNNPLFDINSVNKFVSLLLLFLLSLVLSLDGLLIWQKKAVRIGGHNVAHLLFIIGIMTAIWLSTKGSIL